MAFVMCLFLVAVMFSAFWFVYSALVTPLPPCVQCTLVLDETTEDNLEYAVRAYRFLRRNGLISTELTVDVSNASSEARRMAELLARHGDITIKE